MSQGGGLVGSLGVPAGRWGGKQGGDSDPSGLDGDPNTQFMLLYRGYYPSLNPPGRGGSLLESAFAQAGAFALPPASEDSALLVTLPPGAYTAELNGAAQASGIGLLEIYEIPAQG